MAAWLAVCVLAACAPWSVWAQPARQALDPERMGWVMPDVFDAGSGLDQSVVISVVVTPQRRVWVGTMRGLYRMSGGRMVEVPGPDNAFRQEIRSLVVGPDGVLWVATASSGVFRLTPEGWKQDSPGGNAQSGTVMHMTMVKSGAASQLWAVGRGAFVRRNGAWVAMPLPEALKRQTLRDVAIDPDSPPDRPAIWYASFGEGLHRCDAQGRCKAVPLPPGPRANEIYSLMFVRNGASHDLWVGAFAGGVARLRHGRWTRWHADNSALPSNYVTRLLDVENGDRPQIWVGTRKGPAIFDGERWQSIDIPQPLLRRRVNDLARASDASGRRQVWIGVEGGVLRLPLRDRWRVVRHLEPNSNGVMGIGIEPGAGTAESVWMTLDARGVSRYRDGVWQDFTQADGLPRNEVRNVLVVPPGRENSGIWVGDYFGHVSRFQQGRFVEVPTPWAHSDQVTARLLLDDPDTGLWLSTTGQGMARYQRGQWDWMAPSRMTDAPRHAYAGIKVGDSLWFATAMDGLVRYRNGAWRRFPAESGLPQQMLYSIARIPDARGRDILWIGTETGVLRVDVTDPDHPRKVEDGALPPMPRIQTYDILRDGKGDVLMCTQYGISRLRWRPGQAQAELFTFHQQDGLPHDECNAMAFAKDREGRIWAGTIAGAAVYDPRIDEAVAQPVRLMLDEVRIDDVSQSLLSTGLRLKPRQSLALAFDLPTGNHERRVRYRSQVLGLEAEPSPWNENNTRTWLSLPSGDYTLRIDAMDGNGVSATPLQLALSIPAPWWRHWGMLLLYAVALIGGLTLLYRWRMRALRASHQRLEDTVHERTLALHARGEELRRKNEELEQISYLDALTGLHNRRYLMQRLELLWAAHRASAQPIAVILFDVDHFKQINDQHGHAAGDACLRRIANDLSEALRSQDGAITGRYGGEEFLIVLPGMRETQAATVAERLRARTMQCEDVPVTASFGVAALVPREDKRFDQLLVYADDALYTSKAQGRNRVTCAGLLP